MKKQNSVSKKHLQLSRQTLRELNVSQLDAVDGGSVNGCTGFPTSVAPTVCKVCFE